MNSRVLSAKLFFALLAIIAFFGTFVNGGERTTLVALFFFIPRLESYFFRITDKSGTKFQKAIRWVFFVILLISIGICVFCAMYLHYDKPSISLIGSPDSALLNGVIISYKLVAYGLLILGTLIVAFDVCACSFDPSSVDEHKEETEEEKSVNERITDYVLKGEQ